MFQLNAVVLLIVICNLPQPTLKREDILSEIRAAVRLTILLVPVLGFMWSLATLKVLRLYDLGVIFEYVYVAVFSLQVNSTIYGHSRLLKKYAVAA